MIWWCIIWHDHAWSHRRTEDHRSGSRILSDREQSIPRASPVHEEFQWCTCVEINRHNLVPKFRILVWQVAVPCHRSVYFLTITCIWTLPWTCPRHNSKSADFELRCSQHKKPPQENQVKSSSTWAGPQTLTIPWPERWRCGSSALTDAHGEVQTADAATPHAIQRSDMISRAQETRCDAFAAPIRYLTYTQGIYVHYIHLSLSLSLYIYIYIFIFI